MFYRIDNECQVLDICHDTWHAFYIHVSWSAPARPAGPTVHCLPDACPICPVYPAPAQPYPAPALPGPAQSGRAGRPVVKWVWTGRLDRWLGWARSGGQGRRWARPGKQGRCWRSGKVGGPPEPVGRSGGVRQQNTQNVLLLTKDNFVINQYATFNCILGWQVVKIPLYTIEGLCKRVKPRPLSQKRGHTTLHPYTYNIS